jgi:hypothetical protein
LGNHHVSDESLLQAMAASPCLARKSCLLYMLTCLFRDGDVLTKDKTTSSELRDADGSSVPLNVSGLDQTLPVLPKPNGVDESSTGLTNSGEAE